jgi:enamine deaminase RidA (YjgF/YER057c/UK114 family)
MPAIDRSEPYADLMHLAVAHGDTIYVTDMSEKPAMNRVWQAFFDPAHLPARATIGVADLGPGVRLELVAVLGR